MKCSFIGCPKQFLYKNFKSHEESCNHNPSNVVGCSTVGDYPEYCGFTGTRAELQRHKEVCTKYLIYI